MFEITADDVMAVYTQLKDQYSLVMTTTGALDEGFTMDCPILVGKAHGQIIELYECEGLLVLDVMDEPIHSLIMGYSAFIKIAVDILIPSL